MRKALVTALPALFAGIFCVSAQPLEGVWRSEGWGFVYRIRGADWQAYEVTSTTCVAGFRAKRLPGAMAGRDATFRSRDGDVFYLAPDGDGDHKKMVHPTGLIHIPIERISGLPAACQPPTANTPSGNFEVFARTFAEHYIAFDLRQTQWDRVVAEQRAKITAQTTPAQLFDILKEMIQPLADIHTGLEAPKMKREYDAPLRPGSDRVVHGNIHRFAKTGRRELAQITDRAYLNGPVLSLCHGQWQYGRANGGIGYLRILSFGDYARHGRFEGSVRALNDALDRILSDTALRGLVIDLRLSFGGDDQLGLAIAARLAPQEYPAYAIQARSEPFAANRYTPLQQVMVRPGKQPVFGGSVVLLIGPITMSAAETFTEALMERTPHVARIGENTQGVFCDVLDRRLPNGWGFGLPNAVYRTSEGKAFDVAGIPPEVAVPVFADDDIAAGRDPGMAAAIRLLTQP